MAGKIGVVLGVVGIVFALLGFAGPWWTINFGATAAGVTMKGNADFGLFGGTATVQTPIGTVSNSSSYKDDPNTGSVFLAGAALTGLGLVFGLLLVVLTAMSGSKPKLRRIGAVLGILAFVFALLAPVYVMVQLPGAVNKDGASVLPGGAISGFWGSSSASILGVSMSITWGAGWAWYIVLVGAVLFLVGALLSFRAPAPRAAPGSPWMPPQTPPPSP